MKRVLLVEDEVSVLELLCKGLREAGCEVSLAMDGITALEMALGGAFDIVILDIMLPGKNGIEVCRELRAAGVSTPVLFLTALGTAENVAVGLNTGADDYLVKPFKFIELHARMNALLRRAAPAPDAAPQAARALLSIADLTLDDDAKAVHRAGAEVSLTATEYRLLLELLRNKGKVMSRMDLLESVWGINFNLGTNVVDVYINYLRKKIDAQSEQKLIHTVVGMGYVMREK